MTLKKPKYIMEGYCKSDLPDSSSRWEFICSLDEREYTLDSILVVDYDVIRIRSKKEKEMEEKCRYCYNKYHTSDEHEIFEEYFKKSIPDLVSIIISLEQQVDKLGGVTDTAIDYGSLLRQSHKRNLEREEKRIKEERQTERKEQLERYKKFEKETVTVCFQRGEGARPMSNESFDGDRPITRIKVPIKDTFFKDGKRYYRMVCGHGDYIDLLVEEE